MRKFILLSALMVLGINNSYAQPDTCKLSFNAIADNPACSGKDIQLSATNMPNTTYSWTGPSPNWFPSANVRDPKILSVTAINSGPYIVTATRGVCVYKDTVVVNVLLTPSVGTVIQTGPVCPDENDTILVPQLNVPTGGTVHIYSIWGADVFNNSNGYLYAMNTVKPSQAGIYYIYAESTNGCFSDTVAFDFKVKPDVKADFSFDIKEGCEKDAVVFTNLSTSDRNLNYKSIWSFGDNTPLLTMNDAFIKDTTHYYIVPNPNYNERTYTVTLIIDNGECSDTVDQDVYINHPVKAKFTVDDDSICQGETITFNAGDSSYVKPGSIPKMLWKFGDGSKDAIFNTEHTYKIAGIYNATFIMTDFLGCSDSFKREIVVDSIGFVFFDTDKKSVCVGETIIFSGSYSTYAYKSAIWDFNDGVVISDKTIVEHAYKAPGIYDVRFDVDYRICPDVSFTGHYTVKPIPTVYLGEDTAICPNGAPVFVGDIFNLDNTKGIVYKWNTPTKDVTQGIYVRHPGTYAVTADLDGCTASDSLVVKKNCYIDIPNAFTPNGDGSNDYFLPRQVLSRNVTEFSMQIYNRWGKLIFQSDATNGRGWDGKYKNEEQPVGVYVYTIQVAFGNGVSERYQGNVTLLR